jgi:N-acetylneuraminic acid mutarotase
MSFWFRFAPFLALLLLLSSVPSSLAASAPPGSWVSVAALTTARLDDPLVTLPNGQVLAIGGDNNANPTVTGTLASVERWDPVTNTWSAAASMTNGRTAFTATLLQTGKVLAVGGANAGNDWLASTELYDPASDTWTSAGNLPVGVYQHTATLLSDGRVLVAGGSTNGNVSTNIASIYDPTSNAWSQVASMTYPRTAHTATLLKSGKVLVDGGWNTQMGGTALPYPELYDPLANTWTSAGTSAARYVQEAVLLNNGKVLVVGGLSAGNTPLANVELYNPTNNTWTTAASLPLAVYGSSAITLKDGRVLVAGGTQGAPIGFGSGVSASELYTPSTNSWKVGPTLPAPVIATATLLKSGNVLLAGGDNNGPQAASEVYLPTF